MNNEEKKSLFLKCQCSVHCLEVQRFCYEKELDEGFNVTIWTYGRYGETLCWKERLRWIWNIIRTGQPWSDGVIINNRQSKEIINYINQHLSEKKEINSCPICNTPEGE